MAPLRIAGSAAAAEILAFAALVSVSLTVLAAAIPGRTAYPEVHAREIVRGIILAMSTVPAREMGGLIYGAGIPPLSSEIELGDRTILQLAGELWALHGRGSMMLDNMEDGLRDIASRFMDQMIGGRFSYRLAVEVLRGDVEALAVEVKDLSGAGAFLCSESLSVPFVLQATGTGAPEPAALRITLELWSR